MPFLLPSVTEKKKTNIYNIRGIQAKEIQAFWTERSDRSVSAISIRKMLDRGQTFCPY